MIDQVYDLAARNSLANRTVDLDELEQNLRQIGTLSASEIKDALKNASEALHESAEIIRSGRVKFQMMFSNWPPAPSRPRTKFWTQLF